MISAEPRSLMSRAGVPTDHAERCLGHVIGGVRGVYDRHEYLEEKRRAFEALASQVERIVDPAAEHRPASRRPMRSPTASPFLSAARLIAKGEPPDWLIPALEHFSPLVGYPRNPGDEAEDQAMIEAARNLEQHLATFAGGEEKFGLAVPACVHTVLIELPELIEFLESQLRPVRKGGPTPDSRRKVCAGVCAELWRREHGEMQPFSVKLWEACEEYWQACGNHETSGSGRLKNWEPFLKWARNGRRRMARKYRAPHNPSEIIEVTRGAIHCVVLHLISTPSHPAKRGDQTMINNIPGLLDRAEVCRFFGRHSAESTQLPSTEALGWVAIPLRSKSVPAPPAGSAKNAKRCCEGWLRGGPCDERHQARPNPPLSNW